MAANRNLEATFVVVGGGIAGVSCIEGLSLLEPDTRLILITASPLIKTVKNLVNMSQTICQFEVEERSVSSLEEKYKNVLVVEDALESLDVKSHQIKTQSGKCIKYKKLCLCTGGQPKLINNNPYVIAVRDTESVEMFQKKILKARKIVVVGNGGIATEVVHSMKNLEIVWVIKDKHISATFVDPGAAEFFQSNLLKPKNSNDSISKRLRYTLSRDHSEPKLNHMGAALGPDWLMGLEMSGISAEASNVIVEYECEVKKIQNKPTSISDDSISWPIYVELSNGKVIGCDLIVSATGVIPNSAAFEGTLDLAEDKGIKVNWKMETSCPDIFAAGDVCTVSWEKAKHWFQMRLWTQARQMGIYAAKCMAASNKGEDVLQDFCFEIFSHVTNFFGYKVVLLGLFNGQTLEGDYEVLLRTTKNMEYIKFVMKDGRLHGAILIGETDLEEMCENLILNQLDLSAFGDDLLNPSIDIEDFFD